jgi:DNA-binding transcriptional regulator GbsR (MarR family)
MPRPTDSPATDSPATDSPATKETASPPTGMELGRPIDPELAAEIPAFEQFFKTFGFKRVQGRVWGLLVLSGRPLASKEICEQLEISQAAASTTLNDLSEWGAITSHFDSQRRCHLHAPVGNALSIAATILRRREQVAFEQFRHTADRALHFVKQRYGERDPRVMTLRSIVSACEIAEALMSLLVGAVANALGDPQSILSRAINAAVKVSFSGRSEGPAPEAELLPAGRSQDVVLDEESERG